MTPAHRPTGKTPSLIAVARLSGDARVAVLAHFLALPPEDRRLRFGLTLADDRVANYVAGLDFRRDTIFAVHDDALALAGVAHLAQGDDIAELGLSVLPGHRGRGIGGALFERAVTHARNRFVPRIFMHCLRDNVPIMRIAQKYGMRIVTDADEADAHLGLPPATPASIAGELAGDRCALFDHALKAHAAAWAHMDAALRGIGTDSSARAVE
jgi:GNAT superfamily N-acetyltransferase